ncbi:MAG: HIT domain-containing protein [archaeon]|jgi:diadenosine tetraphosphate (Ap4A) HIT family hydrolase|nr:HIT domain-containing protein [archaeon]MDD2477858.1 HIT domain-containing protein [Candidatus ainarchaeum sp.]MDD3084593.1 HIT domain-containing protein [Candidatus ainarchaeum sp.]MDD4221118.1 HIT domain-containing protein [Candidatus ainarchaeum sp.]MDD4662605.1 HIT domain-containing protein [Candidatus ainarchaeum sp.]
MQKENCIFCKIVKKEIPSAIIYEDEDFVAFLDNMPNTKGMTIVTTKDHFDSYVFDLPDEVYSKLLLVSKKVSKILEKGLKVKRVAMVFEGEGVNHIHAKLYPMHNIDTSKFEELSGGVYFENYPGYITTLVGPQKTSEKLKKIAKEILDKK